MTSFAGWRTAGRWGLTVRVSTAGAGAGLASWLLAMTVYPLFGALRPGLHQLPAAVMRGAPVGGIVGFVLGVLRDRMSRGKVSQR